MHNSIGIISCEKVCLEFAITGSFVSLMKRNVSHNCGSFSPHREIIVLPPPKSNLHPPPPPAICDLLTA